MIIIKHRSNSISDLGGLPSKYGVEIDLRSSGHDLILEHDPFKEGVKFYDWLKHYHHKLLIINVKEDGLEELAIKIISDFEVSSFFFLDQSFPSLYQLSRHCPQYCSTRVSEFEPFDSALLLKPGWIWFDSHSGDWEYLQEAFKAISGKGVKTCLVSPELQNRYSLDEVDKLKSIIKESSISFDAVCTKLPEIWE